MNDSQKDAMKHFALQLKPALEITDPFDIRDIKDKLPDTKTPQMWMQHLHKEDVVTRAGKVHTGRGTVNKWEWREGANKWLLDYAEQMNTLPCGCRSHIPSDIGADSDTGTCKNCGKVHDKEVFKNSV
jgi:hypothetical protein